MPNVDVRARSRAVKRHPQHAEVVDVTTASMVRRAEKYVEYRIQWIGLSLGGPARLDDEHDPIEQLRRRYDRPPRKTHPRRPTRGYVALDRLPD